LKQNSIPCNSPNVDTSESKAGISGGADIWLVLQQLAGVGDQVELDVFSLNDGNGTRAIQ
jgi:hypothetical protein